MTSILLETLNNVKKNPTTEQKAEVEHDTPEFPQPKRAYKENTKMVPSILSYHWWFKHHYQRTLLTEWTLKLLTELTMKCTESAFFLMCACLLLMT